LSSRGQLVQGNCPRTSSRPTRLVRLDATEAHERPSLHDERGHDRPLRQRIRPTPAPGGPSPLRAGRRLPAAGATAARGWERLRRLRLEHRDPVPTPREQRVVLLREPDPGEVGAEFPDTSSRPTLRQPRCPPEMPPDMASTPANLTVMFANICACTIHAYDDRSAGRWRAGSDGPPVVQAHGQALDVQLQLHHARQPGHHHPMVIASAEHPVLKSWALSASTTRTRRLGDVGLTTASSGRLEWDTKADVDAILETLREMVRPSRAPMKATTSPGGGFERPQHGHERSSSARSTASP